MIFEHIEYFACNSNIIIILLRVTLIEILYLEIWIIKYYINTFRNHNSVTDLKNIVVLFM